MTAIVSQLILALGVGWCAGLNLYATLAVLGLLDRYLPGFDLPSGLAVLQSWWVIVPSVIMYVAEFVADKVPAFDSVWDSVHTFIRVPAGAVLAAMALGPIPLEMQIGAGIIGGTLALQAHTTKAMTRVMSHGSGTSPIVTPVASLMEDALVFTAMGLYTSYPILSLVFVVGMIIVSAVLLIVFWKVARTIYAKLFRRQELAPLHASGTA